MLEGLQRAADFVGSVSGFWFAHKVAFEHGLAFGDDALHPIMGVALALAAAAIMRRGLDSWWPWTAVLILELLNEWTDLSVDPWPTAAGPPNRGTQFGESAKDVLLTMVLPTVLLLAARYLPSLLVRAARPDDDNSADAG